MLHPPRFPCFLLSLLSMVPIATADAATLYVSQAGDNSNGATWGTAYTTISGAVTSSKALDHILVMEGTYYESILIEKPVFITGGYSDSNLENGGLAQDRNDVSLVDGSNTGHVAVRSITSCSLDKIAVRNETKAAMSIVDGAFVRLDRMHVYESSAFGLAGGITVWGSNVSIRDSTIENNRTTGPGGGITIDKQSVVTIENSTIANNVSISGGGILVAGFSTLGMRNCSVVGNIASTGFLDPDSPGGGIRVSTSNVLAENCVFANNDGISGHQVNVTEPEGVVRFSECTFHGKYAPYPEDGQIVMVRGAAPEFENCIFGGMGPMFVLRQTSTVTVTHSCVLGGYPGEGNISDDPLFRDPANGDFRLQYESPCIDAGAMTGPADDLDGNPRPIDIPGVGREGDSAFDMGAFEFQLPILSPDPRTDINQDGLRDETDLLLLLQDWHRVSAPSAN